MSTGPAEPQEAVDDMVQVDKGFLEALRDPNRRSEGIALSSIPWAVLKRYPFSPEELTVLLDWLDSEIEDGEALPPIFRCPIEEVHCKGAWRRSVGVSAHVKLSWMRGCTCLNGMARGVEPATGPVDGWQVDCGPCEECEEDRAPVWPWPWHPRSPLRK